MPGVGRFRKYSRTDAGIAGAVEWLHANRKNVAKVSAEAIESGLAAKSILVRTYVEQHRPLTPGSRPSGKRHLQFQMGEEVTTSATQVFTWMSSAPAASENKKKRRQSAPAGTAFRASRPRMRHSQDAAGAGGAAAGATAEAAGAGDDAMAVDGASELEAILAELQASQEASRAELEASRAELQASQEASRAELEASRAELEASRAELEASRAELEASREASRGQLEFSRKASRAELEASRAELEASREASRAVVLAFSKELERAERELRDSENFKDMLLSQFITEGQAMDAKVDELSQLILPSHLITANVKSVTPGELAHIRTSLRMRLLVVKEAQMAKAKLWAARFSGTEAGTAAERFEKYPNEDRFVAAFRAVEVAEAAAAAAAPEAPDELCRYCCNPDVPKENLRVCSNNACGYMICTACITRARVGGCPCCKHAMQTPPIVIE